MESKLNSRRQVLKKASAFVIPTIVTFKLSELKVHACGGSGNQYRKGKGIKKTKTKKIKRQKRFKLR